MLKDHVVPQIKQRRVFSHTIFMQDGAPPHYEKGTSVLKEQFQNRLISRGCDVPWPPRRPDLSPLDYWFWAWLKSKVFTLQSQLRSIEDLKRRIVEVCKSITPEEFSSDVSNLLIRFGYMREAGMALLNTCIEIRFSFVFLTPHFTNDKNITTLIFSYFQNIVFLIQTT